MTKDIKVVNSHDLLTLAKSAERHDFNRQLDIPVLKKDIDPDGYHILSMVLYGHNMDTAPILHHRAQVLIKVKGTKDPQYVYLDIADKDWRRLKDAEPEAEAG